MAIRLWWCGLCMAAVLAVAGLAGCDAPGGQGDEDVTEGASLDMGGGVDTVGGVDTFTGGGVDTIESSKDTQSSPSYDTSAACDAAGPLPSMELDEDGQPLDPTYQEGEQYEDYGENPFIPTSEEPTSTFSVDVDTASYSITRRDLNNGVLPVPDGVRVEEFVNYFEYDYLDPVGDDPFSINLEVAPSYFGDGYELVRIGIKGYEVPEEERDPANLVFLIDVSGSMSSSSKLELVKYSLKELVKKLKRTDTLAIAVYASAEGTVLEPTPVEEKSTILDAIDNLTAGGSTAGEAGINLAYSLAESAYVADGINRVVLCTDGDFNVGATGDDLIAIIEEYRDKGIFLTVLGYGMGNYNDATMEQLADKGNGNYAYIDSKNEALRVLGDNLVGTLQVIAKDVKVQITFDETNVTKYRLVGYENRLLDNEDFIDDQVDAGEIGAGHYVTAFYEIELAEGAEAGALATVKFRYKEPDGDVSIELEESLSMSDMEASFDDASEGFRFAAAVMEFAEILRGSQFSEGALFDDVAAIVSGTVMATSFDGIELLELIGIAESLWPSP